MPVVAGEKKGLPDIVPLDVGKKEYMTEKRKIAIAKARKARSQKIAIRSANKGRAMRALKGIKSMYEAMKKRECTCGGNGTAVAASAPEKRKQDVINRGIPKLIGGPRLTF